MPAKNKPEKRDPQTSAGWSKVGGGVSGRGPQFRRDAQRRGAERGPVHPPQVQVRPPAPGLRQAAPPVPSPRPGRPAAPRAAPRAAGLALPPPAARGRGGARGGRGAGRSGGRERRAPPDVPPAPPPAPPGGGRPGRGLSLRHPGMEGGGGALKPKALAGWGPAGGRRPGPGTRAAPLNPHPLFPPPLPAGPRRQTGRGNRPKLPGRRGRRLRRWRGSETDAKGLVQLDEPHHRLQRPPVGAGEHTRPRREGGPRTDETNTDQHRPLGRERGVHGAVQHRRARRQGPQRGGLG